MSQGIARVSLILLAVSLPLLAGSCFDKVDQFDAGAAPADGPGDVPEGSGGNGGAVVGSGGAGGMAGETAVDAPAPPPGPATCTGCNTGSRCSSDTGDMIVTSCQEGRCQVDTTSCGGNGCLASRCNSCKPGINVCNGDRLEICATDGSGYNGAACPGSRRCEMNSCSTRCVEGFIECAGVCEPGSCCPPPGGRRCSTTRCVGAGQCCKECPRGCFDETCVINVAFDGWRDVREDGTDYGNTMSISFSGDKMVTVRYVAGPQNGMVRGLTFTGYNQLKYDEFPNTGTAVSETLIDWGPGVGTWRR